MTRSEAYDSRTSWSLIGTSFQISANKLLLVWNKKTQRPELATICHSEDEEEGGTGDPRGDLWTEDCGKRLIWSDYCHYCYVGCPLVSSAHKELGVYAYSSERGEWVRALVVPPDATHVANNAAIALRNVGLTAVVTTDGRPPKGKP